MTPSLEGPRIKVFRAEEHIRDLDGRTRQFLQVQTCRVVAEDDPKTGDRVFRLRGLLSGMDAQFATIVGDVVHNLRSALDLLVWQLVLVNGEKPTNRNAFPILQMAKAFPSAANVQLKGCGEKAVRVVRSLKPYRRGNPSLWCLHRLDIVTKHRLLLPVGTAHAGTYFEGWIEPNQLHPHRIFHNPPRAFPMKNGAELWRILAPWRSNPNVDMNPEFAFEVSFGKIEGLQVEGKSIIPTLSGLARVVDDVIDRFEIFFK